MAEGPREFELTGEGEQYKKAFQNLMDRLKLRQWCIEQMRGATFTNDVQLIDSARNIFDFCCEDIAAWLARYQKEAE